MAMLMIKCPQTGQDVSSIEPDVPDYDRRTFECPSCKHVETAVVRYR